MPKEILNNKIIYQNIYGRIAEFDGFLDQGVTTGDSPTFGNLYLTGNANIDGNLYVQGNTTIINTNVVEFEDNIILINRLETGAGVTLNQSGFEIERGSLENYRFVFNESDDTFKIGVISNLQAVATRQDTPLVNGIMTWNNTDKRIDSVDLIQLNTTFGSTTNSTSSTNGSLMVLGGVGIKKDVFIDGELNLVGSNVTNKSKIWTDTITNILTIQSPQDINLTPTTKIKIPFDKPLTFGNDNQSIKASLATNDITIKGSGHVKFDLPFGKRIDVPNLIPITFSTQDEKIYANGLNNMVITGSEHIELTPGDGKSVILPVNIPITFYSNTQKIFANLLNDLNIAAANNIYITPGSNLNVEIPYNANLKFGNGGNQTIKSDTSNALIIRSNDEIKLTATTYIKVPTAVPIALGNSYQESMTSDTFGNLILNASSKIKLNSKTEFLDTTNSTTSANGAIVVSGGVGITKNLNVGGNVSITGNLTVQGTTTTVNSEVVTLKDNLFVVNSEPTSELDCGLLIKRLSGNYAGMYYKESSDEITLAYTSNDPGLANVIIDSYIPFRADKINLENTQDAINFSTGSIIAQGGASIKKSLIVGNSITTGSLNVTGHSYINQLTGGTVTITNSTINSLRIINDLNVESNTDVINSTTASFILNGGMSILKTLWVGSKTKIFDTTSSTFTTGALILSGGISIQNTENASSITSGGGITIRGGGSIEKDLYVGKNINTNNIIVNSTDNSTNASSGSIVTNGGVTIKSSSNSESLTNGGALTVFGGASLNKDVYIGGNLSINGALTNIENDLNIDNSLGYSGGGGIYTINNTTGNSQWYYLGQLNQTTDLNYFDCEITNSINNSLSQKTYNLKVVISIQDTSVSFQQSHVGNINYNDTDKGDIYLYKEGPLINNYHIFYKTCLNSSSTLRILHKTDTRINIINEGTNSNEPNGDTSGYSTSWVFVNSSNKESNLNYNIGNLTADGNILKTADPLPIIGNNTIYTDNTESINRNVGLMFSRYQKENDSSLGDIITDTPSFTDTIPDQSTASPTQIKLSNSANSTNNYYNGWWIKCVGQVRRIVSYNGAQRIAQVETEWTTQPVNGTSVNLYNFSYYSILFDEQDKKAKLISTSRKESQLTKIDYISLEAKSLNLFDTTSSSNASTGSIVSYGGISVNNTTNASSCTEGGTLTTLGGGSFRKNVYIGEKLGIGQNSFSLDTSLHIKQQTSTIKLANDANEYSYIDFEEQSSLNKFGIFSKNSDGIFCLTYSSSNASPNTSNSSLTIKSNGNIGIQTTSNINSAITFKKDNIISLTENNGYLGLISGNAQNIANSYTCGASILLNGSGSSGDLNLSTGTIGNLNIYAQNVLRFNLNKDGIINFYSTNASTNSTTAAFLINGGMSIKCTENAVSYTNGGSLTIAGGASIKKDTYIQGDLYVNGTITSDVDVTPLISFSNLQNCTLNTYGNNSLILNGTKALLSFYVEVYPTTASQNCQLEFDLPEKLSNLTKRMDLIATCNGYTDDTELIPLFNTLCIGKTGSNKGIIKFQSNSINLHYLNIICRYSTE